jgi:hypothetical protein
MERTGSGAEEGCPQKSRKVDKRGSAEDRGAPVTVAFASVNHERAPM